MSTDLSTLLHSATSKRKRNDAKNSSSKPKRTRAPKKTKEEREAENLQLEILAEEKFVCDYETYTVEQTETVPLKNDPTKKVVRIKWLDNKRPSSDLLKNMGQTTQKLAHVSIGVQGDSARNQSWLLERSTRIVTSSKVARQLAMAEPFVPGTRRIKQSFHALFEDAKLVPIFEGNSLTDHGKRMEPFARKVYMQQCAKQHIVEVGFIPHKSNELCGASPDGVLLDGTRLVELKCPKKRSFQVGDSAPLGYWHQCQLQMEVCDCGKLDYFEVRHMRRPRGIRTNCVFIRRDPAWFESIQQPIKHYAKNLKRLKRLRKLFPKSMFEHNQRNIAEETGPNIASMFRGVQLQQ